ncbi:uncharacterized protein [Panulirus ornatus]|uniref:uncharacterized protein n=1 Tax=Panulirus ornatus TaxID=150431 RepID=UPI003A848C87
MRDMTSMAVVVPERDRPSPKVWQPWYMEESEGGGKELPTRAHRDQRARDRLALARPPHRITPSPERGCSSEDEINVVDSPPPAPLYAHPYYTPALMDDDVPLDMSTKRRSPPPARLPHHIPTSNSPSPPPYHPRSTYLPAPARARPTVITCVPPRYLATHDLPPAEPAHMHAHRELPPAYSERPLPPPYSVATAHLSQQRALTSRDSTAIPRPLVTTTPISPAHRDAPRAEEPPTLRRQVVQAGPVDPEIDEHFRRSLGKDYQQLFAATPAKPAPSTDSVDDHFAKALGETWVKLQAERRDSTASNSSSSSNSNGGNSNSGCVGVGGGGAVVRRVSPARTSPAAVPRLIST